MPFIKRLYAFPRCREGNVAVEFAFVLPALLILSLAGLEFALIMFDYHNASEATRRGARGAIIEPPMISLANITTSGITCTYKGDSTTPTCTGVTAASDATATFKKIAAAMAAMVPQAKNTSDVTLTVTYRDSTITDGASTNIYTPAITVRMTGLGYDFFLSKLVGTAGFDYPGFDTTRIGPSEISS